MGRLRPRTPRRPRWAVELQLHGMAEDEDDAAEDEDDTGRLAGRTSSSSPWPAARVDEEDAAEDEDGTAHRALRLRLASSCCCSWASARRGRRGWPTPCVLAVAVACVPELSRACVLAVLEALACVPERRPPRAC